MKHMIYSLFIIVIIWLMLLPYKLHYIETKEPQSEDIEVVLKHSDFMKDWEADSKTMMAACEYYGLKYPKIVTAQAILESGDFKSNVFKKYNNPFGLYNSNTKDYYKFSHWTYAIIAYKTMIQNKYKGGDYYKFLEELPYAEDKNYIKAVKAIESVI